MTTLDEATESIYQRFVDNWGVTPPFTFDNEAFDPPEGPWVRLSVRNTGRSQITLAPKTLRRYRSTASIFVQAFVPVNSGRRDANLLVERARDIFEGESFDDVEVNDAEVRESPTEDNWAGSLMEAFFNYDAIK